MAAPLRSKQLFPIISDFCDNLDGELRNISLSLWNRPELAYEEHHAHDLLTAYLEQQGFTVQHSFHLPTAFCATFTSADFDPNQHSTVCFFAEYDALPTIGHACGHNLIAITGVGAAVALKMLLAKSKTYSTETISGKIICMGSPAEETTGGKIDLLQAGALNGVDFCLMAHPAGYNMVAPDVLGLLECEVTFSHDASNESNLPGCPFGQDVQDAQQSVVDASIALYAKLSLFRQQLQTANQIHGVIYHAGVECQDGRWMARSHYYLRAPTVVRMAELKRVFQNAVDAAAMFSDCQRKCDYAVVPFEGLMTNQKMGQVYRKYAELTGTVFPALPPSYGSTDMGNISNVIPSIHPMYSVRASPSSNPDLLIHTEEFQVAAGQPEAHRQTLNTAKALAMTGLELFMNAELASTAKEEFRLTRGASHANAV
ncbi:xaa-Arg dipeptidase-like [Paramacrobiotus metropolitanus]|uniref:xaa-Arg dipeptidase-like n=1 Tax=Paramacrobiotus metropolitanus TaxID=2943436 RepID=UPI002445D619|nr:xaa-Arg dipeptidase-like [Paramacrobiotus metropolitanus]